MDDGPQANFVNAVNSQHSAFQHDKTINNLTPYRYYRFRFPDVYVKRNVKITKFALYTTKVIKNSRPSYNPKHISIHSNNEIAYDLATSNEQLTSAIYADFAHYPGIHKGTFNINTSDLSKTCSIANFNSTHGNPLSKHYTVQFVGSYYYSITYIWPRNLLS